MLLRDARRDARVGPDGVGVALEDQDRTRWHRAQIDEGLALVRRVTRLGRPGPYQVQAAISAAHVESPSAATTDWPAIVVLYGVLAEMRPSPVVALNRAVAVSMADGPAAGLEVLDALRLDERLATYLPLHAARADMLRRLGRKAEAAVADRRALALCRVAAERAFLEGRLAACTPPG